MKINKLWIPMIIFGIIGGIAKLCDTIFNVNGVGFFVNSEICSAIFVISIVLVWLIGVILLIADRKVDIKLSPPKSKVTGLFGFIAAVSIMGTGIISLLSLGSSTFLAGSIILAILSLAGGGVLLYESCVSFTKHNGMVKFPLAGLLVTGWSCGRLINLFIDYSKVSIHATEMFDVISVTFLTVFLFYQAMFFAEVGTRSAVRRSTLYGICYVMCGLITTTDLLIKMFSPNPQTGNIDTLILEPTIGRILMCVADLAFVAYAASFVISNSLHAKYERPDRISDDDDDSEFLSAISTERKPKSVEQPKKGGDRKMKATPVRTRGKLGIDESYEDDPTEENETPVLDFSNLKKAMNDINKPSEDGFVRSGRLSFDDDEPAPVNDEDENETPLLSFDDDIKPAPMTFESVQNTEPAPMTFESVQNTEPAPMTFESVQNTEPAPMTFESVQNTEPAPMTFESVQDTEPEPMTIESVQESEPEEPADEPVQELNIEEEVAEPLQKDIFEDEDPFDDDDGQEDYDEIFRLLDEMGTDD